MVLPCQDCSQTQTPGPANNVEEQAVTPVDKGMKVLKIVKEGIYCMKVVVPSATLTKRKRERR